MRTSIPVGVAGAALLVLAGCADDGAPERAAATRTMTETADTASPADAGRAQPTRVTMTATDFAFDLPAEIEAGLVTFEMPNQGQEAHHAQLVRVNEGGDLDTALAALAEEDLETVFREVTVAGGVGIIPPGATAAATVDLQPGEYAFVCGLPSPDGTPHAAKGMVQQFTVTGEAPAQPPTVDSVGEITLDTVGEVTLDEFAFGLPDDLDGTVAVTNTGQQPHEMLLLQLGEGVGLEEALASIDAPPPTDGPPPAIPAGGMQAIMPGQTGYLDLGGLDPGRYAIVCFVPDPESGKAHLELGMVRELELG